MNILLMLLSICFLAITWVLCVYFLSPTVKNFKATIDIEHIMKYADNGDLIFLSGDTYGEKAIRFYTACPWSHVAFVIRENDEIFLWEADIGQSYKRGPRVIRLKDKLERMKCMNIGMWRSFTGKRPVLLDIMKIVHEYENFDMDDSMVCWLFSKYPESFLFKSFKKKATLFCSELIALTLQLLDILPRKYHPSFYSPSDFAYSLNDTYALPQYFLTKK